MAGDEAAAAQQRQALNLEDRKVRFCVEGIEGEAWNEYMTATRRAEAAKRKEKAAKIHSMGARGAAAKQYMRLSTAVIHNMLKSTAILHDSTEEESEEESSEDSNLSDNFESSDEDIEMVEYESEITKEMWIPNDPKLYVVYNGRKWVNYNDE